MMKLPSIFTKTPKHKRFNFTPRFYDPLEEDRKEREARIRKEIQVEQGNEDLENYRSRIAGSFKSGRPYGSSRQANSSASLLRVIILLVLSIWLVGYLQFGNTANYLLIAFVPVYLFLKFRKK